MTNVRTGKFQSKVMSVNHSLLISSLGKTSIDSLKARIPTRYIENFSICNLKQDIITLDSQGEIINEKSRYKYDSVGFGFALRAESKKNEEELIIMFHSKVIGSKYFEGIHKDTIKIAYKAINETLNNLEIGNISYSAFLKCRLTDVDIKCDYQDNQGLQLGKVAKHIIDTSKSNRVLSTFAPNGRSSFKSGLQLNSRTTGSLGSPFTKIYNKGIEINENISKHQNKSTDSFFSSIPTAANDRQITNVWRSELTMKNKAMLESNGLPNTLGELIQVSEEQLNEVLQSNFMKWVKKEIKPVKEKAIKTGLNIEDSILLDCIKRGVYTYDSYVSLINTTNTSKSTIKRKKKRFVELLHLADSNTPTKQKPSLNRPKTDSNNLGNSNSDLATFCEGILYAAN